MKKAFLLGAIPFTALASPSPAAQPLVIDVPQPVEQRRVCDTYGQGYVFLPGAQTCLKIGGQFRFERGEADPLTGQSRAARFTPSFTTKSQTGLGALTGFAQVDLGWDNTPNDATRRVTAGYLDLEGLRVGKLDTPYSRFLDHAGLIKIAGPYVGGQSSQISYTYRGDTGLRLIAAAVQDPLRETSRPNLEAGARIDREWGSFGAIAGWDDQAGSWGTRAVIRLDLPQTDNEIAFQLLYSDRRHSAASAYPEHDTLGERGAWSALGGISAKIGQRFAIAGSSEYFTDREWEFGANISWTPTENFSVTPGIVYSTLGTHSLTSMARYKRSF